MMFTRFISRFLVIVLVLGLFSAGPMLKQTAAQPVIQTALNCTFTVSKPVVNLRSGAGTEFDVVGQLANAETMAVINQAAGSDGFVWWQSADGWVRSDMGTSDCPSTCGNTICEYGETATSCAQDCTSTGANTGTATATNTENLISTGTGCLVENSQACYESVDCWPNCNICDSWLNDFGCVTCFCEEPATSTGTGTTTTTATTSSPAATGTGCVFATCDDCIAAFPCTDGACTQTSCDLNEFGCPVCTTSN